MDRIGVYMSEIDKELLNELAEKLEATKGVREELRALIPSILVTAPLIGDCKKVVLLLDWLIGLHLKGQKTISLDKVMKYWNNLKG